MRLRIIFVVILIALVFAFSTDAYSSEKWQGTDDLVDRKMEQVTGVKAKEPLIDISQGNLGLFIFAAGGFIAGTVFGYQWRKIFIEKAGK
jgi:ABC-type cobalt transport system substrate-binding protein